MCKVYPSVKSYTFQANVYNEKIGSAFGKTVNITVSANNETNAYKKAKITFNKYINSLYTHYNIDGNNQIRKNIIVFNYNNLKLV